jgi:WS/DGAT/MGAT family acyltransferase
MVDGVSGSELIAALLTREPQEKPDPVARWQPRPPPSGIELGLGEISRALGAPRAIAASLQRWLRDEGGARHEASERMRAMARLIGASAGLATPVPFNRRVGPHRRIDWLKMRFSEIRAVRAAAGGTVNDVVLATAAAGFARYLSRDRGVRLEGVRFRVMAPVSTRTEAQRGTFGNRVSAWMVDLPLAEPDPAKQLEQIRRQTEELKRSKQALAAEMLTRATEWTGSALLSIGARLILYGTPFNAVITNVPGPRTPLHLLESRLQEIHPHVPIAGTLGIGIALFSYDDTLSWGFTGDWDLVPDLHALVLATERGFAELRRAVGAG